MPRKKKKKLREELKNQTMLGMDGAERKLEDFFEEDGFDESKDKTQIFVRHAALLKAAIRAFDGIKDRRCKLLGQPHKADDYISAAQVVYKFGNGLVVESTADCSRGTANREFRNYTTALAETRASSRALRLALGIEMITHEEMTDIEDLITQGSKDPASDSQKNIIEQKFMKEKGKTFEDISEILDREVITLNELTVRDATEILEYFNCEKN